MKRKRYPDEQIVSILEKLEAAASAPELSRRHGVIDLSLESEVWQLGSFRSQAVKKCARGHVYRYGYRILSTNARRFRVLNSANEVFSRVRAGGYRHIDRLKCHLIKTTVLDNESEFRSKAMFVWSKRVGVKLHVIRPAPWFGLRKAVNPQRSTRTARNPDSSK